MPHTALHAQEHWLLPIGAGASAARHCPELGFNDPIARQLAYRWRQQIAQLDLHPLRLRHHCHRSAWLDQQMLRLLTDYPHALCLNLGSGFDTTRARLSGELAHTALDWIDLDTPEVIRLKRELLLPHPQHLLYAAQLEQGGWSKRLPRPQGRAVLVRAEGLFARLSRAQVQQLLGELANWSITASSVHLLFDWHSPLAATSLAQPQNAGLHGVERLLEHDPRWQSLISADLAPALGGASRWLGALHRQLLGPALFGCHVFQRNTAA